MLTLPSSSTENVTMDSSAEVRITSIIFKIGLANFAQGRLKAALIDLEDAASKVSGEPKVHIQGEIRRVRAEVENKQFKDLAVPKAAAPPV